MPIGTIINDDDLESGGWKYISTNPEKSQIWVNDKKKKTIVWDPESLEVIKNL